MPRRVAVIVLPLLALAGCGGGGGDEDAIKANVTRFFASDPRGCDFETARLIRNTQDVASTSAAMASCRKREKQRQAGQSTDSPFAPTTGAAVSAVEVDGSKATATAKLQGGDLAGQVLDIRLVEEGDVWKLDGIDGLRVEGRVRDTYDKAFAAAVRPVLSGQVDDDKVESTLACIVERFTAAVPNERLADQYEGKLAPGTLSKVGEEAARQCLAASSDESSSSSS